MIVSWYLSAHTKRQDRPTDNKSRKIERETLYFLKFGLPYSSSS